MPNNLITARLALDDTNLLRVDGQLLKLQPKEGGALRLLLRQAPDAVRKDDFARHVWAGQSMSDETLARCISKLRRVLAAFDVGVDAVYGVGYRLVEQQAHAPRASEPGPQVLSSYAYARQLMQQRTPDAAALAIDLLRRVVGDEPGFGLGRVALADTLAIAVGWGQLPTEAAVEEGLAALQPLNGDDARACGVAAAQGALLDMAWRFDRATQLEGDNPETLLAFARHLLYTDRAPQAVDQLRRVRQLAPHALIARMTLTRALLQSGLGTEAVAEARATVADHPGQLVAAAVSLSIQAMVAPHKDQEAAANRLMRGLETPRFVWTVSSHVLARLGRREAALDIVDAALLCQRTTVGEATLYAAPLAALGEFDRAAALLHAAVEQRCGMMAMVLRDPAHAAWLPRHATGRALLRTVFGGAAAAGS